MLNDFEANGYGILALKSEDVIVLHDAQPQAKVRALPQAASELCTTTCSAGCFYCLQALLALQAPASCAA